MLPSILRYPLTLVSVLQWLIRPPVLYCMTIVVFPMSVSGPGSHHQKNTSVSHCTSGSYTDPCPTRFFEISRKDHTPRSTSISTRSLYPPLLTRFKGRHRNIRHWRARTCLADDRNEGIAPHALAGRLGHHQPWRKLSIGQENRKR
jgi:hypothetical protein